MKQGVDEGDGQEASSGSSTGITCSLRATPSPSASRLIIGRVVEALPSPWSSMWAIFNQQPMGFYNLETLKEDAKRHETNVLNPHINDSMEKCIIKDESVLLGFLNVLGVGEAAASRIVEVRDQGTPFSSLGDVMERTGLQRTALENLVLAGVFDTVAPDRRKTLWEVGLRYRPGGVQQVLALPVEQDMAQLSPLSQWEAMAGEYHTMGIHPQGHLMGLLRPYLDRNILTSLDIPDLEDGAQVTVAGLVIRRQRPLSKAVYLTLEDEHGHIPLIVWPGAYERYRMELKEPVLKVQGVVSRREGTLNIAVTHVESIDALRYVPKAKDWQ